MVSSCYIYMVSFYVIRRLCHGAPVLYIYGELLCNFETCAMVSSCVLTKLARMQICAIVNIARQSYPAFRCDTRCSCNVCLLSVLREMQ